MVQITREQFDVLDNAGLIDRSKANKNFTVTSKYKSSKRKKYYVVENRKIMMYLKTGKLPSKT